MIILDKHSIEKTRSLHPLVTWQATSSRRRVSAVVIVSNFFFVRSCWRLLSTSWRCGCTLPCRTLPSSLSPSSASSTSLGGGKGRERADEALNRSKRPWNRWRGKASWQEGVVVGRGMRERVGVLSGWINPAIRHRSFKLFQGARCSGIV